MNQEEFSYTFNATNYKGVLFYEKKEKKLPLVLVLPTWLGLDAFAFDKAKEIAKLGYLSFAFDHYGNGLVLQTPEEAKKQMTPLLEDRMRIRNNLKTAIEKLSQHPLVDSSHIAAIGYCFGGSSVLELAKSGHTLNGVVSIHGVLGNPHKIAMKPVPTLDIRTKVLVLHGYNDTLSTDDDICKFEKEMNDQKVDWQMVIYGGAMHAFTNPQANRPETGFQYNEKAAKRSFLATKQFLSEVFSILH